MRWFLVLVAGLVGFAAWAGFRLPEAPREIWVPLRHELEPKPEAPTAVAPGGAWTGFVGWFELPDGSGSATWDPTLVVRLETEAPLVRRAATSLWTGTNATHATVGVYRLAGDRVEADGHTWARYVRD